MKIIYYSWNQLTRTTFVLRQISLATLRIDSLRAHIQIHRTMCWTIVSPSFLSQETYARKNSKPQGLEQYLSMNFWKPAVCGLAKVTVSACKRMTAGPFRFADHQGSPHIKESRTWMQAAVLQCLKLQIRVASPDPPTRASPEMPHFRSGPISVDPMIAVHSAGELLHTP